MLTDEQKAVLSARYRIGADTLSALWDEAYRLGMLRAAGVCDLGAKVSIDVSVAAGCARCANAIRAEAGETTPSP